MSTCKKLLTNIEGKKTSKIHGMHVNQKHKKKQQTGHLLFKINGFLSCP